MRQTRATFETTSSCSFSTVVEPFIDLWTPNAAPFTIRIRRERKYKYHGHWLESCAAASTPRQAMTEYCRKLDAVVQSRYLEKLKLLGLEEKDGPYEAS